MKFEMMSIIQYRSRILSTAIALLTFTCWCQAQSSQLSFLALGDSYTIGESVSEDERWPVLLAERLREKYINIGDPEILAVTGWTTLDLRGAISASNLTPHYDLVTLLIGVNDQYRGFDEDDYPGNFSFLLSKAIELAGNRPDHVLVLSIPDYGVTPFGQRKNPGIIGKEIDAYNEVNKRISDRMGVHYFDITPISRKASVQNNLVADDGLHPSGLMYNKWVDKILPVILPKIKTWNHR